MVPPCFFSLLVFVCVDLLCMGREYGVIRSGGTKLMQCLREMSMKTSLPFPLLRAIHIMEGDQSENL